MTEVIKDISRFYNTQIAKIFRVSSSTIDNVINRVTWSDNEAYRDNQQPRLAER